MKIVIKQPAGLNEAGSSAHNADFVYPLLSTTNPSERFFYVCDGEGQGGETAAKQVALNLAKYFAGQAVQEALTPAILDEALRNAEEALSSYKIAHPENKDMRTSLALLHLGTEQVTFGWVGDAMLYHYDYEAERLVSVTEGTIYDIKARISGSDKPQRIHLKQIPVAQIKPSDYFFLATQGIREHVDRNTLNTMLKPEDSAKPDALVEEIRNLSQGFAQEDFSCYLIQVDRVEGAAAATPPLPGEVTAAAPPPSPAEKAAAGNPALWRSILFAALILAVIAIVVIAWWATTRQQPYDNYLARGEALMASNEHRQAMVIFDSAYGAAANEHERQEAARLKGKALALSEVEGEEWLDEPAEAYLAEGDRHFAAGNWGAALDAYDKAARAEPADPNTPVEVPVGRRAEAHLRLGDQSYEQEVRDCEAAVANYQAAFTLFESPELDTTAGDRYAQARTRAAECTRALAAQSGAASQDQLAEGGQGTRTRSLAPQGQSAPAPQAIREAAPTATDQPDPRASRLASPDPEPSSLNRSTLSAEEEARLRTQMDNGKRLFSKARSSNSRYEYRVSAQNLEAAAPILDGSGNYLLAYLYHSGLADQPDPAKALKYAQKAAAQGWPAGQHLYGHLLLLRGNPRDTVTAIQSLKQARDNNFLEAIERLQKLGVQ